MRGYVAQPASPGTDGEEENGSPDAFNSPSGGGSDAKRADRGTPGSVQSPSVEPERKKAAPKRQGKPKTGQQRRPRGQPRGASKEVAHAESAPPRPQGKKTASKKAVEFVSQAVEDLLVRARGAPGVCLCEFAATQKVSDLVALARRIEGERRCGGADRRPFAVKKSQAIAYICPVHLDDVDEVAKIVERDKGPRTSLEDWKRKVATVLDAWKDTPLPPDDMSVMTAYMWFMLRVLRQSLFGAGSPDDALFVALVPHLLRDLLVNHNWHIVEGYSRVGARGTRQHADGLTNLGEFSTIMLYCVAHYSGDHARCGLSRTPYSVCVESINILASPAVVQAAIAAASKACTFVTLRRVTNVVTPYPNQGDLAGHFTVV